MIYLLLTLFFFLGSLFGITIMCLLQAGARADRIMEYEEDIYN